MSRPIAKNHFGSAAPIRKTLKKKGTERGSNLLGEMPVCTGCGRNLPHDCFTSNQLNRGKTKRCRECVIAKRRDGDVNTVMPAARGNGLDFGGKTSFPDNVFEQPFGEGAFRFVGLGRYDGGPRNGTKCVAKWFKNQIRAESEDEFFSVDVRTADRAIQILTSFNQLRLFNGSARLNHAMVMRLWGRAVLLEPFIENYEKYNSNSGWACSGKFLCDLSGAIAHFSYHNSKGVELLCDLQGAYDPRTGDLLLTDPVICSLEKTYGVTDLGAAGIASFMARHQCGSLCNTSWQRPQLSHRAVSALLPIQMGTSMMSSTSRTGGEMSSVRRSVVADVLAQRYGLGRYQMY